jgi:hypothetical protein
MIVLAGSLAVAVSSARGGEMYAGVAPNTSVGVAGSLLRISDTDGSAVVVGDPITPGGLSGLTFDSTGRLFGSTRLGGQPPGPSELVEIDPVSGSLIQSFGEIRDAAGNEVGVSDLAVQPGTDQIFAAGANNTPCVVGGESAFCIYSIDRTTALATLVGPLVLDGVLFANGGLAFTPGGTLYLVESGSAPTLSIIDPSDASILNSVPLVFGTGVTYQGVDVSGNPAPLDGLGARPEDGALFATGAAGPLAVLTVSLDGEVAFVTEDVGAKPTDIAFPPDICPGGDDSLDGDGDGVPDFCDICLAGDDAVESDGDGVPDACDPCPFDASNDADGDGVCGDVDVCLGGDDTVDADDDTTPDACDVCPADPENDADDDGICESADNCPLIANSGQADLDGDGIGDVCDDDLDADGVLNDLDNCPFDPNPDQGDADGDGIGDACDDTGVDDLDGDGVVDADDACPETLPGEIVDAVGCSIAQVCPCEHLVGGDKWKNHGAYVSCVARTSEDFLEAGLIGEAEKDATVSAGAASSCGTKVK